MVYQTVKLRAPFVRWVRRQAKQDGMLISRFIEKLAAESFDGKPPWDPSNKEPRRG
jgi:hypothetical protein